MIKVRILFLFRVYLITGILIGLSGYCSELIAQAQTYQLSEQNFYYNPNAMFDMPLSQSYDQPQWYPNQSPSIPQSDSSQLFQPVEQPAQSLIQEDWKDGFSNSFYGESSHLIASRNHSGQRITATTIKRGTSQVLEPRAPRYDHWSNPSKSHSTWQLLPSGLIYSSYLAGAKEPRTSAQVVKQDGFGWIWDASLGGRAGIVRYGSQESVLPEGFQIDIEGAVALRMNLEHERDMMANDFRFGFPITFGNKYWQFKTGYYHVSSHMGDEYMITNNAMSDRINYYRDSIVLGISRRFCQHFRVYAETAYAAFGCGEQTDPWEFQFGIEFAPIYPANGFRGSPFVAVNAQLFEELDFSGYLCVQAGWMWRGASNQMFRIGLQYINGYDDQYEFHYDNIQKIGFGIWYDY